MKISKQEKELLQQAFSVPEPKKKREFLRALPRQQMSLGALILSQAAYIRKWVWAVSFLLFVPVVMLVGYITVDILWVLSAVMPVAALLVVTEVARSAVYGMAEMEMTARFSLRMILLARMVMLGAVQLLGLIPVAFIVGVSLLQNAVYLLVPYLLTAYFSLMAVRYLQGKEGMYACGSISVFICVLCPLSRYGVPAMYDAEGFVFWLLAAALLMVGFVRQYRKTMIHLEEFAWN